MKAQLNSEVIKYFIIAIVIAASLLFGYKAISSIKESHCRAQLTIMEADLKDSVRVKATDLGSKEELKLNIPCNADFVFALDLEKKDEDKNSIVKESFYDYPIIKESIETNAKNNLFVVKDKKIVASFDIGKIAIEYPYYECYRIRGGRLGLLLEGKGSKTGLLQLDKKYDCTFDKTYSVEMASDDEDKLCGDVNKIDIDVDPSGCNDDAIIVDRTIEDEDGKKIITIDIEANNEFSYYEELPKCVAHGFITFFSGTTPYKYKIDINPETGQPTLYKELSPGVWDTVEDGDAVFENVLIGDTIITLIIKKADPLMVWHFIGDQIQKEKIIYELSELEEEITSDCLRQIKGVVTPSILSVTASANPTSVMVGDIINFGCTAAGGTGSYEYTWNFGDGLTSGPQPTGDTPHNYLTAGTYPATCTVKDTSSGEEASDSVDISVSDVLSFSGSYDYKGIVYLTPPATYNYLDPAIVGNLLKAGMSTPDISRSFIQFKIPPASFDPVASIEKIEVKLTVQTGVAGSDIIVGHTANDLTTLSNKNVYLSAGAFTYFNNQPSMPTAQKTFIICNNPADCNSILNPTDTYFSIGIKSSNEADPIIDLDATNPELIVTYTIP